MPKKVNSAERARCVSVSLTAEHLFILERLMKIRIATGMDSSSALREILEIAGAQAGVHAYNYGHHGKLRTAEFEEWLEERGWQGEKDAYGRNGTGQITLFAPLKTPEKILNPEMIETSLEEVWK